MDIAWANCVTELSAAGWLPRGAGGFAVEPPPEKDLLADIVASWRQEIVTGHGRPRRSTVIRDRLLIWQQTGAQLTWTAPDQPQSRTARWLGARLIWWPHGVPSGHRLAVLSSRVERDWDLRWIWFAALRQLCVQRSPESPTLVAAEGTAAAQAVRRAAQLFDLPLLWVVSPRDRERLSSWLRDIGKETPSAPEKAGPSVARLSPALPGAGVPPADAPVRDRALVALGYELVAVSIRTRGHVQRLLQQCLLDSSPDRPIVRVVDDPRLVRPALLQELRQQGAAAIGVPPRLPIRVSQPARSVDRGRPAVPLIAVPAAHDWSYLSHWTRAAADGWPDESTDEYLDRLLGGDPLGDHSAFGTLQRIVREEQLRATAAAIRGGIPVVCFTAAPLTELNQRRVFRRHRGRWDFEPYGISIRQSYLEQAGARPVYYGVDEEWAQLPAAERPFFQLQRTRGRRAAIDWTEEREWRHPGSLDLRPLSPTDALLFVPTRVEAELLAEISRWPIVVLTEG